ncbi:transposase [Streptomyces sp. NPDC059096]|uniref:transposase n=1 Tax=Streptomyces sp. NPDC059096 TaxID=3346727 RepID=UPI0036A89674
MLALLRQLEAASKAADDLEQAVAEVFPQHPEAEIILSLPGLGIQLGARVLAEIGDDRHRFADARGLKAYAGASPITRASGKKCLLRPNASPGAKRHYRRRRDHGDWHASAQRNLFNRLLGQLYHFVQHGHRFEEAVAFPPHQLLLSPRWPERSNLTKVRRPAEVSPGCPG